MRGRPVASDVVTRELNATYLAGGGTRVPLPTTLLFDPMDPVAITMRMRLPDRKLIVWTFARQLFADGDQQATGIGDVRVRPVVRGMRRLLAVDLAGRSGHVTVELPATRVSDFVRHSYDLVPASAEEVFIDLELGLVLGLDHR